MCSEAAIAVATSQKSPIMDQKFINSERFRSLDAWRGLCALAVAFFHLPVVHLLTDRPVFANLQLCVDFFFVLSGFVISHAYQARMASWPDAGRFHCHALRSPMAASRIRLAFLHRPRTCEAAGQHGQSGTGKSHAGSTIRARALSLGNRDERMVVSRLLEFIRRRAGISPPGAWPRNSTPISCSQPFRSPFQAANISSLRSWRFYPAQILLRLSPQTLFVSFDWGFFRCAFGFFVGCLLYRLKELSPEHLRWATFLEISVCVLVAVFLLLSSPGPIHYVAPLAFSLLIYVFSFDQGSISTTLKAAPFQNLGLWSYSIYMVHVFIFQFTRSTAVYLSRMTGIGSFEQRHGEKLLLLDPSTTALVLAFAATIILVIPVAAATYRWIERPCTQFIRKRTLGAERTISMVRETSLEGRIEVKLAAAPK